MPARPIPEKPYVAALDFVLCHADFHDANLLIDPTGRLFIVDWDEIILAPKERDLVFVTDTPGDLRQLQDTQALCCSLKGTAKLKSIP